MTPQFDGWRAIVLDRNGEACGAGVLVAADLVLTCAHVVTRALSPPTPSPTIRSPAAPSGRPNGTVTLVLPADADAAPRAAHVTADGWVPQAEDFSGDLALLRLDEPVGTPPATLAPCGAPTDRGVRACGYRRDDPVGGRWASARVAGTAGPRNEWVQLTDVNVPGYRIEPGFSGAGVKEDDSDLIIGVVVGVDRAPGVKVAWMISMETVAARLPAVRPLLRSRTTEVEPSVVRTSREEYEDLLVEGLMGLDGLRVVAGRAELVTALESRLGPLGVTVGRRDADDLAAIVRAAMDHPGGAGVAELNAVVRDLYGDAPEAERFTLLAALANRRVLGDELDRLVAPLSRLPVDQILDAVRIALGPLAPRSPIELGDLRAVIGMLTGHIGRAGAPPLLVFLKRLARLRPSHESGVLEEWLQRLAERWQIPLEAVTAVAEAPARVAPQRSYLVVELREDGPTPGAYLLSVQLQHDDGTGEAYVMNDDQPLGLQEIPGHLGSYLRRALHGVTPIGELWIEFVLPTELLSHEVDQFQVVLDHDLVRLGSAYPVVVRSGDRMRRSLLRRRWEVRSRWMRENGHEHDVHAITWVPLPAGGGPGLERWLRGRDGYSDLLPVCLVFTWRGANHLTRTLPAALGEALELGMPALLWCRNARLSDAFAAEFANQLNGLAVAQLVHRVHQLRREAAGRAEHVGSHVCLLWDDPERSMPEQGLSAPI